MSTMTASDQLTDVVNFLAPCAEVRPGIAGMVLVGGVPMLRVSKDTEIMRPAARTGHPWR